MSGIGGLVWILALYTHGIGNHKIGRPPADMAFFCTCTVRSEDVCKSAV